MPIPAASLANLEKRAVGRSSPNKFTASIKEMVEKALHKAGGVEYLTEQAHKNPVAFMGLVGRVLPLQLASKDSDGNPIALHLLAAINIGAQILEQQQAPPTINGKAVNGTGNSDNMLDAPLPTE